MQRNNLDYLKQVKRKRSASFLTAILALVFFSGSLSSSQPARAAKSKIKEETNYAPCLSWPAQGKPKAVFLLIHGLGLDATSYGAFAREMAGQGINCYAIDVRGFGSWARAAGHEQVDFDACLKDIEITLRSIRESSNNKDLPLIVVGESMGGAIALRAASLYPELMTAVISSVPAAERFQEKRTDLKAALDFLKGPNRPSSVSASIIDQASTDENLKTMWKCDPLSRFDLSPHELLQFQRFMNENHEAAKSISVPVLMLQGSKDKLVKPQGSYDLFNRIKCERKIFISLPSEHLILEEQQTKSDTFTEGVNYLVTGWINALTQAAKPQTKEPEAALAELEKKEAVPEPPQITSQPTETQKEPENPIKIEEVLKESSVDPLDKEMALAIAELRKQNFSQAKELLKGITATEPLNSDAHYWLSAALAALGENKKAIEERNLAMSLRKLNPGNKETSARGNYLTGNTETGQFSPANGEMTTDPQTLAAGKPTVLIFQAPWCAECTGIEAVSEGIKKAYPDLNIFSINVDEPQNRNLVRFYKLGPIPSFVFLNRDGSLSSTVIGRSTYAGLSGELKKIFNPR
ncbi:MAG: alpha/beta fold hydrolase [Candidatus Obscuribacter phosphatis]|uniref:Alpha/beta fold hydrolase n=1 Tax=Candidatus Obscuribacter phosphatis TaxID=1906157 RepID=A0A8J7TN14_9BACT|nr:alpha/beta fold hydrolase [Candidatus Obscuribacter phosphatis]